jgi:hypothetical protein
MYGYLADLLVVVHAAYASFIVFGLVAVLVGAVLRWEWVRNRWFRCIHLLMIAVVALEGIIKMECPLTVWERVLRGWAGQEVSEATFMGRVVHNLLFYNFPEWAFTLLYIGVTLVLISTFYFAPVRWRPNRPAPGQLASGSPT